MFGHIGVSVTHHHRQAAILLHFNIPREEIEGWLFVDTGREMPICIAQREKNEVIFTPDAAALTVPS